MTQTSRFLLWPRWINWTLVGVGALLIGGRLSIAAAGPHAETVLIPGSDRTITQTTVVKRVVHGHVVHERHKVYVIVPMIRVRTDHRVITIPAHKLPVRGATAAIALAKKPVTVYVTVPVDAAPIVVTSTVTSTVTETQIIPTTITVPVESQ